MQLGFALLEAGTVRSKNVKSALLKNVLDLCVAALCWYIIGNALSGAGSTDLHYHKTGLLNTRGNYNPEALTNLRSFVIMYGFLATATTIVSGAILSRLNLYVYLVSSMVMSIFIYPIGAFWMWNRAGWLYRLGAVDNAGGVVVHVCGGSAALVSAYIAGPRAGRFMRVGATWIDRSVDPHSSVLQFMGINMLWVGWMAFNGASLYQDGGIVLVERAMRNTLLGGTAGFIGAFIFAHCGAEPVYPARRKFLVPSLTGILGGLAGTTSNCGVVDAWAALFIGFISSIAAAKSSALLSKYRIDDPVEAAPVHLVGGAVGMICTGLFATDTTMKIIRGPDAPVGLFYSSFFDLRLLGIQLLSVLVYCTWSMLFTSATLLLLKKLIGKDKFTYSRKAQILGLDYSTDGGVAYPDFTFINVKKTGSSSGGSGGGSVSGVSGGSGSGSGSGGGGGSGSGFSSGSNNTTDSINNNVVNTQSGRGDMEMGNVEENGSTEKKNDLNGGELRRRGHGDNNNTAVSSTSTTSTSTTLSLSTREESKDETNNGSIPKKKPKRRPKPTEEMILMMSKIRFTIEHGDSKKSIEQASPVNCLDNIMNSTENRCVLLMTSLNYKYSLAAMKREVDREFLGNYKLIAVPSDLPIVIVELKRPIAVMRFVAQFKIERWSDEGSPGTTVTNSGTIIEMEKPNIEYSKIQNHEKLLQFIHTYKTIQFVEIDENKNL